MLVMFAVLGMMVLAGLRLWAPSVSKIIRRFVRRVINTFIPTYINTRVSNPSNPNRRTRRARMFTREERSLHGHIFSAMRTRLVRLAGRPTRSSVSKLTRKEWGWSGDRQVKKYLSALKEAQRWVSNRPLHVHKHGKKVIRQAKSIKALACVITPKTAMILSCPTKGPSPRRITNGHRANTVDSRRLEAVYQRVMYSGRMISTPKTLVASNIARETWLISRIQTQSMVVA